MSSSGKTTTRDHAAIKELKCPDRLPWVLPVSCEGCGGCVNACPNRQLKMTETNVKGVFVPWLDDPTKCSGCGRCCRSCAMGAISMTSYVDLAYTRFIEKRPEIPVDDDIA